MKMRSNRNTILGIKTEKVAERKTPNRKMENSNPIEKWKI